MKGAGAYLLQVIGNDLLFGDHTIQSLREREHRLSQYETLNRCYFELQRNEIVIIHINKVNQLIDF